MIQLLSEENTQKKKIYLRSVIYHSRIYRMIKGDGIEEKKKTNKKGGMKKRK